VDVETFSVRFDRPQLEINKDPELMRKILQEHLKPFGNANYEIRECHISYIHYREGFRCVVHYDLRLVEPDTEREHIQLVTGVIYDEGGKTQRIWKQLRKPEPVLGYAGTVTDFEPFSYVSSLDMLLQVFPYDYQLPGLTLLMAGPRNGLEPLLLARFGSGEWQARSWDVKPLRYRATQRAALRLTAHAKDLASNRTEERNFYAKVYNREERGEQAYQLLQELWEKSESVGAPFTVGRPIAYLSNIRTLLQEEIPGITLGKVLRKEEEAIPAVRKVARALAALHQLDVTMPRRRHLQDEITKLETARESLVSACPHLRTHIEETFATIVANLEEVTPALVHGDLKPAHILLDSDRVAVIDFDNAVGADPVMDVAQLLFKLAHGNSRALAQAFTEEYFSYVPVAWRARLPLLYADDILKKAASFYRRQKPGWRDDVEPLLREARSCLSGEAW
jgi:Ser/Thr protein kinase RdoA (MazF antagonist)